VNPSRALEGEATSIIALLDLQPHPEGGFYAETWRDRPADGSRGSGTAIYYLLRAGDESAWHRHDAAEAWHHYAGAPLELLFTAEGAHPADPDARLERHLLGSDVEHGERPQVIVPAQRWQHARSLGDWTLTGCTVSPAFSFESFELAHAPDRHG
jgi:uncharacterized protein